MGCHREPGLSLPSAFTNSRYISRRYTGFPITGYELLQAENSKDNSFKPEIGKYPDKLLLKYFETHAEADPRVHPYLAQCHQGEERRN
jgi:hypothetical protein